MNTMIKVSENNFVMPELMNKVFGFHCNDDLSFDDAMNAEFFEKLAYENKGIPHNATASAVYFSENYLLFTSESSHKNWLYYAGLEYVEEERGEPNIVKVDGEFYALYSRDGSERVERLIDNLNNER